MASVSVFKLVMHIQNTGNAITAATLQPSRVRPNFRIWFPRVNRVPVFRGVYVSSERAKDRSKKTARMLANTMASKPATDAAPMSYSIKT